MIHKNAHPSARKTVKIRWNNETIDYRLEDWWDRVSGCSWMDSKGNPAAINYAIRSGFGSLPIDDEVVYGKIGDMSKLIHVSEIVN